MSRPDIVLVVAVAENGVIGVDGRLPWRIRADLRRFRAVTMGKPMLMGRATFHSIGRVLDGRDSIVLSRQPGFSVEGAIVAPDLDAALAIAADLAEKRGASEICVIGGAAIFAATLPLAARLHVTHVAASPEGDVFFPPVAAADWVETFREDLPFREGDTAPASYAIYRRR